MLPSRWLFALCVLLAALIGWLSWRNGSSGRQPEEAHAVTITKQPVHFANRTFDRANPETDMPPLTPGEVAACESDFLASATVGGQTRPIDATHATLTVTHINVNLGLNVVIWAPADATPHVLEHEQGHRQISEHYYQTADKLAEGIAAKYVGRQVEIAGTDLQAEGSNSLRQMAADITAEYKRELNPGPTQLLYDDITDHSRNEVVADDAVAHAIKNIAVESPQPSGSN